MNGSKAKKRRKFSSDSRAAAREALGRLARIAHRCGLSRAEILATMTAAVAQLPTRPRTDRIAADLPAAPHLLTVWHDDPFYSNGQGYPRPLPKSGPAPSFESLVRAVDASLDVDTVLAYLLRAKSVRREGGRYVAVSKLVLLRGIRGPADARTMRNVNAMLRTVEHNSEPESDAPGWLERTVDNHEFPLSRLDDFEPFLERETMSYLRALDGYLRTAEVERDPAEPTLVLGVGVYRFQEEIEGATIRRRGTQQGKRGGPQRGGPRKS